MDKFLIVTGLLFIASVFFSKISDRYGVPALIMFLGIGMISGSDGIFNIWFDDVKFTQHVGTIALIFILFAGGLDTSLKSIAPVFKSGLVLATLGVVITAFLVGIFVYLVLDFSFMQSLLLGAIVSSTDAAAVFAILRSRGIKLKNNLGELLEFESGSNDPMAIFLTVTIIGVLTTTASPEAGMWVVNLLLQFIIGGLVGWGFGSAIPSIMNRINLNAWGLYPVLLVAMVVFVFGATSKMGGNGYIAVYIAGIFANKREFVYKKNLIGFFDGIGWLMQVFIFLTIGLLVFPSELPSVALISLFIAIFIMFVARPVSVFISLVFSKFSPKEKFFISWVGIRGVVPVILATYPLAAGIDKSHIMFNIVFFVVFISVIVQGSTLSKVASFFGVKVETCSEPSGENTKPIYYSGLRQFSVPKNSKLEGLNLAEVEFDDSFLVLLVKRNDEFIKPGGSYKFHSGDLLLIHCGNENLYRSETARFDTP